jgi:hypothetical protein
MIDRTQKLLIPVRQNEAGAVVNDGGRNVWQWKDEQLDSTSVVLKRLENEALELEPTRKVPIAKPNDDGKGDGKRVRRGATRGTLSATFDVDADGGVEAGGGFDPYNHR